MKGDWKLPSAAVALVIASVALGVSIASFILVVIWHVMHP